MGIVGLPNVGKSTLFNALLKKQVALEANYPFATIDPNVGIIEVPDERLQKLAEIVHTTKIVPAAVEFYDIAGLVKGASQGEGLGNQFLTHIREVAATLHVVRLFEDKDIIHVDNKVDPVSDIQTIETELILADLQTLNKQKEPKGTSAPKEAFAAYEVVKKLKNHLDGGKPARTLSLHIEEVEAVRPLNLITFKPVIYCFNCSLEQLEDQEGTKKKIDELLTTLGYEPEHVGYMLFNPLEETTLITLIKKAYETLGLISFLTAGEKEARAWTITKGTLAPQAAGTIHTDFEKKFIKADVATYEDFVSCNGWTGSREKGKVQICGKDHEMKDGDVVEFKIGS
ncbi:MAG: redox-regulated ATPase YchF [Microgenomates group bacterium]